MINALTFDIEDWYHICGLDSGITSPAKWPEYESRVEENTNRLLTILSQNNVCATFFVLGYIAQRYPRLIKQIDTAGHEIATHGFWHNLVYRQTPLAFRQDLRQSVNILQDITGKAVLGHRCASFSITRDSLWALDELLAEGIRYYCSIFPIAHPRYGIAAAPRFVYQIRPGLTEFPPSTVRILGRNFPISGGICFRQLPYFILRKLIIRMNQNGHPAQIYIHPWELDLTQPRLKIPLDRKIAHYANIRCVSVKLKALLREFSFGPVKKVLAIVFV